MSPSGPQKIQRSRLTGALLRPFGLRYWGVEQTDFGITFHGRARRHIPFSEMVAPAKVTRSFGFSTVALPLKDNTEVKVVGTKPKKLANFTSAARAPPSNYISKQFAAVEQVLRALSEVVERLKRPRRYPSACLLAPFLARATSNLYAK